MSWTTCLSHSLFFSYDWYNDENTLSCVISIAFYYAHGDYIFHRELPTGKGYADLVLMPRKSVEKPAIVIELKSNETASRAIAQIRRSTPAR